MDATEVTNREFEVFQPVHRDKRVPDADGDDIPEVYGLGEAGLFDEFFYLQLKRLLCIVYDKNHIFY